MKVEIILKLNEQPPKLARERKANLWPRGLVKQEQIELKD